MQQSTGIPPLVSVIVPSYNYAHLIAETLSCLQAQSYPHWECVIIDDGSTDNTKEIVAAISASDNRIRYCRQQNQRQAAARNFGLKETSGSYVQFLDADDLIEPDKLSSQVEFLEQHAEVDLVYSGVRYFSNEQPDERLLSRQYSIWEDGKQWMPETSGHGESLLPRLLRNNIMVVNSPLVRRALIDRVGLFSIELTPVEDWEYWIRCALAGATFNYHDSQGIRALVRSHSQSASLDGRSMLRATLRMRRAVGAFPLTDELRRLNESLSAEAEGLLGIEEAVNGRTGRGIYQMCKAALKDRRSRYRAKWLLCAASAPFVSSDRLKGMVTGSLTRSARKN